MTTIPKRVHDRLSTELSKFKKILTKSIKLDINESDTVTIVVDMLSNIFGYERYEEITKEYAVQNTYCDLAIRINDSVHYLVEVKSVGTTLNDKHITQAVNYGAKEGIRWIILTNGHTWSVYNVKLKNKIIYTKIFDLNFLDITMKKTDDLERIFILSKEGIKKDVIKEYHERMKCVNKYVITGLILDDTIIKEIRKGLKRISAGLKIDNSEIEDILLNDIVRRQILDGEDFQMAKKKIRKACKKQVKS